VLAVLAAAVFAANPAAELRNPEEGWGYLLKTGSGVR